MLMRSFLRLKIQHTKGENRSIPHVMYQMNAHTCRPAHQFLERHTSDDDDFLKRITLTGGIYKLTRRDRIKGVIQPNNDSM